MNLFPMQLLRESFMTNKNKSNTSPELLNVTGMKSTENIVEEFQKKKNMKLSRIIRTPTLFPFYPSRFMK